MSQITDPADVAFRYLVQSGDGIIEMFRSANDIPIAPWNAPTWAKRFDFPYVGRWNDIGLAAIDIAKNQYDNLMASRDMDDSLFNQLRRISASVMSKLEIAKPFLDANQTEGWPPSVKLKVGWLMAASDLEIQAGLSPEKTRRAVDRLNSSFEWVESRSELARQRYKDGYHANPFGEPVRRVT